MKFAYYPGCSLRGTGRAYEESLLEVCKILDVELLELPDWNCCGATTYMSVDELKSYALAARNLSIAGREQMDIIAPCAACYLVLNKTQHYVEDYPHIKKIVENAIAAIGMRYTPDVKVRHPLDVFLNDVGTKKIQEQVKHSLKGLKVAPYYGCQIVRPYSTFDNQRNPTSMDKLLQACGATAVDYPLKTYCCGGSQKGTLPEVGVDLLNNLISTAKTAGADVIATVCPLCQFNLDVFQDEVATINKSDFRIPVVYFTQLMGLAFGVPPEKLGLQRGFVPIEPLLHEKELVSA